jgi:hypothetical protein
MVRQCAVWRVDQIDPRNDKPIKGESPLPMPTEEAFLDFLEIHAEPKERRAAWKQFAR